MDSTENTARQRPGLLDDIVQWLREFPSEFNRCWELLPNKSLFLVLFVAWLIFFQFLGNATFGYVDTKSLMYWMYNSYNNEQSDGQDSHGNIIPFVVLALFWWKRNTLLALPIRAWWPGLVMLTLALGLHLLGYMVQQPRISIVAMFLGIYALMGLAWGPAWLRASFFPFFLLGFCIPISMFGEAISFPLRQLVTRIVTFICNNFLMMHVIREGTEIYNAKHTFQYEVAAACSGLRSLVATFAIGTIYGFMTFDKPWKRILMMLAAFPLAVLGNVIRMLFIVVTAQVRGQTAGNWVHESSVFSMIPYVATFVGVIAIGHWIRERQERMPPMTGAPA